MKHGGGDERRPTRIATRSTPGAAAAEASRGEPTRMMGKVKYLERRLELGRGVHGGAQQAEARGYRLCPCEHGGGHGT